MSDRTESRLYDAEYDIRDLRSDVRRLQSRIDELGGIVDDVLKSLNDQNAMVMNMIESIRKVVP